MRKTTPTLFCLLLLIASYYTYVRFLRSTEFPADYDTWTAKNKMEWMWNKVLADNGQSSSYTLHKTLMDALPTWLGGLDFGVTGNLFSDEMPEGRVKGIHSVGKVALVKMTFNEEAKKRGYTGNFEGSNYALMRASGGEPPSEAGSVASMSIKAFRDGAPSGNIMANYTVEKQSRSGADYFINPMCNNVPVIYFSWSATGFKNKALNIVFSKAAPNPAGATGLSDFAMYNEKGQKSPKLKNPFAVIFMPNKVLKAQRGCKVDGQLFGCMPGAGTEIWKMYAVENAVTQDEIDNNPGLIHEIGVIESMTDFHPSKFVDEKVFFRHVYWESELDATGTRSTWGEKAKTDKFWDGMGAMRFEKHIPQFDGTFNPGP